MPLCIQSFDVFCQERTAATEGNWKVATSWWVIQAADRETLCPGSLEAFFTDVAVSIDIGFDHDTNVDWVCAMYTLPVHCVAIFANSPTRLADNEAH